jgi:hypothetical protein
MFARSSRYEGIELLTGIPAESMDEADFFTDALKAAFVRLANALKTEKAE